MKGCGSRELVVLGNGEILVNITDGVDIAEVTRELRESWEWDALTVEVLPPTEDDEEEPTEWLVLIGARPREAAAA